MATTFNLELRKRPNSKGLFPVYIRITKDRRSKRIQTSVAISRVADWNMKGAKNQNWVRASDRNASVLNDALAKELGEVMQIYRENKHDAPEVLKSKVQASGVSESFVEYAKSYLDFLKDTANTSAPLYGLFYGWLSSWVQESGRADLTFSEITPAVVGEFHSFLLQAERKQGKIEGRLGANYIRTMLVRFRKLLNKAISEGLMSADQYPFGRAKYRMPKETSTNKEALSEEEIHAIEGLIYPERSALWNARNAFLFSYYCAGIRVGDLVRLRWSNIEDSGSKLVYKMNKNKKNRSFSLMPQAKAILGFYKTEESKPSDYIFPYLNSSADYAREEDPEVLPADLKKLLFSQVSSKNALINKLLKRIASDAGLSKNLSFHISRHSFASIAMEKAVPSKVVQEALAHSSLLTTERYLHEFKNEEVDNALLKVFEYQPDMEAVQRINREGTEALLRALKALDKETLDEVLKRL